MNKLILGLLVLSSLPFDVLSARTYLRADGSSDTYALINRIFGGGGTAENPDCSHSSFGRHIYQANDGDLNKQVFYFPAHVNSDNDRCQNFDRQRNEIRPDNGGLTGHDGDRMSFSWVFKLPSDFQPSDSFTHIFQLKASGGADDSMPLITFTPRRGSPNKFELIHVNSAHTTNKLQIVNLAPFLGKWVKAKVYVTYGVQASGRFSCTLSDFNSGASLLSYSGNIQMWRSGANYYRPKWGIYRSLANKGQLKDEIVRFDNFCVAKGDPECT